MLANLIWGAGALVIGGYMLVPSSARRSSDERRRLAEIAITIAVTVALAWPLGLYLARIWQGERTWLDPVLRPSSAWSTPAPA